MKRRVYCALLVATVGVACAMPYALAGIVDGWWLAQVVRPALWLMVMGVALVLIREDPDARIISDRRVIVLGYLLGVAHVALLLVSGFVAGFGRSPYSFAPMGIALNIFYVGSLILGSELARSYLLGAGRSRFVFSVVGTAVLFALADISPQSVLSLRDGQAAVELLGGRLLPALSEGVLLSMFVFLGGAWAAVSYRAVLEGFRWLFPALPALTPLVAGFATAFISVVLLIVLAVLNRDRLPEEVARDQGDDSVSGVWSWAAIGLFAVAIVWFASGALGPRPLVVVSKSMSPGIEIGDIVVAQPVEPADIRAGDVIAFTSREGTIIHRVLRVEGDGASPFFVTKGDANQMRDPEAVVSPNVEGRVRIVVPWVGWTSIKVKEALGTVASSDDPS